MFGIIRILPSFWVTGTISHGGFREVHRCGLLFGA
jgi:hypothetical protein